MSYGGDSDRGPFLNIITWVFTSIALVAAALRLASRRLLENQNWEIDDAFMILAISVIVARAIYLSVTISMGFGKHLDELLEEDPIKTVALGRLLVILQAIGLWTFTLPKLPVVALLVRLFSKANNRVVVLFYPMITALILLVIAITVTTFVQCTPIEKNWNPTILTGHCWNPQINVNLGYLAGSFSAFLDFSFATYPIIRLSKLQMDRTRKVLVIASLSLGFIAGITTIYKLTTISSLLDKADPMWATIPLEVWNSVESTALIIAASIPMTRPIMIVVARGIKDLTSQISSIVGMSSAKGHDNTSSSKTSKNASSFAIDRFSSQQGFKLSQSNDEEILLKEPSVKKSSISSVER